MATTAKPRKKSKPLPFAHRLVLNQWTLNLFEVETFEALAEHLRDEGLEGLDENNIHRLHHALVDHFPQLDELPPDLLLEYDQSIVSATQRLNERRITRGDEPIVWKYFQYLALLFTEIYLDRYFGDPSGLVADLNAQIESFNDGKQDSDRLEPIGTDASAKDELNKLSLWCATGSGKTLMMHANIIQFQRHLIKHEGRDVLDHIILLTPNEGLSAQHLAEFQAAGIEAELFNPDGRGLFTGRAVEIIDIHKLDDDKGIKRVAVDAFEGKNLVLIDEGHRGAGAGQSGKWMRFRQVLCERGFSFEYSATFGQAVKGDNDLSELYAKNILFDYSYKYFYRDGFGKDFQILNLDSGTQEREQELYMVACLLSFFQQQRLYANEAHVLQTFQIEKPLWIFVGGRVTASLANKDASDIIEVLRFLARFTSDRARTIERISRVLNHGLKTASGHDLFADRFTYLNSSGLSAEQIFSEILDLLFNAPGGGTLHVENLLGATGEVGLRLGENDHFGVINVGDDKKLCDRCEEFDELVVTPGKEFASSLFTLINEPDSKVNLLIGSKKFTEGWSSWRVSTMGLMNVGKGEGAQIIQLFGRGVRLQGYDWSLKRSKMANLPDGLARPKFIDVLETLGIFGVHADYMAQFRDFLAEEELPTGDDLEEITLPVNLNLGDTKLKMVRLKKQINGVSTEFGDAFKRLGPIPLLGPPDPTSDPATEQLQRNKVVLNWYPKIRALRSEGLRGGEESVEHNEALLESQHIAFLDFDRLYFDLERFKAERGWHNLNLTRAGVAALVEDSTWYTLQIPAEELVFDSFEKVRLWEEIVLALLKKYMERYYAFRKREWEANHLESRELSADDPNLLGIGEEIGDDYYRVQVDKSRVDVTKKLEELRTMIIDQVTTPPWEFQGLRSINFSHSLLEPMLHLEGQLVEIAPTPLNKGEARFVDDLKVFRERNPGYFEGKELYLLRNLSRGRGVGFFEAGNFHPDFIVWLIVDEHQHVVYVDPKGIRQLGPRDPKVEFFRTIKETEAKLGDREMTLHSFIVSRTPSNEVTKLWSMDKAAIQERHVLFQDEDKDVYIQEMFDAVLSE